MYRQNRKVAAPRALVIGLDWIQFHTPPYMVGLQDQPIRLMKEIRLTLSTFNSINAWRNAERNMKLDGFMQFCNANPDLVKFMRELWQAQEERDLEQGK